MQVDYLIIGQGISGSFLSFYLLKAGKTVLVLDEYRGDSASRVASGVINPVTGRRVVTTWMIDELLPFAVEAYDDIGSDLGITAATEISMINFHTTGQMQNAWHSRVSEGCEYISDINNVKSYENFFNVYHGVGLTSPVLHIDLGGLLPAWRSRLKEQNTLLEDHFNIDEMEIHDKTVVYKDISAGKLILCNGVSGFDNKYFKKLPYTLNKGEALIVKIEGLPQSAIYKYGINLVPIGNDTFWVGSSFEWEYNDPAPTDVFRSFVENTLAKWLKLSYTILDHKAAIRPGSVERRPFVGLHPTMPLIGIFNGMGTKGCSLAPYFASQFASFLTQDTLIHPEADIARFKTLLSAR